MDKKVKIISSKYLVLIFVLTLTSGLQTTLTQEQAIGLAEKFVIDNGYTSLPPSKSKLSFELLDLLGDGNVDNILKSRHNTLQLKAFCILEDNDVWNVGFLSTKIDLSELDSVQRRSDLRGRAVIVMKDGKGIRMAHKEPMFSYFKKLPDK